MEKQKTYPNVKFVSKAIDAVNVLLEELVSRKKEKLHYSLTCSSGLDKWRFDNFPEFIDQYASADDAGYHPWSDSYDVSVQYSGNLGVKFSIASVKAPNREEILKLFNILESYLPESTLPQTPEPPPKPRPQPKIFIGHGGSTQWRDLKDHLQDKHDYDVEAYEVGSRAGHTIRDILEEMLSRSSIAFLVLTAEDQMPDGTFHARQNVIHETGLFQGRLGFSRAIILLEEGTEEFSNIAGIQQIRFSKGKIKETFGEVLAVLRREFGEQNS